MLVTVGTVLIAASCSTTAGPGASKSRTPEVVDPSAPAVAYTGAGFEPDRLEIEVGQQVRFVNQSDKDFWPASNIHPTHQVLPEFDATTPIAPGEAWAFTFTEAGFWRYHNHLGPEKAGLIVARGDAKERPAPLVIDASSIQFEEPGDLSVSEYVNLYRSDIFLEEFVKTYGPIHAVRLVSEGAQHVDVLCHKRAHDIGRKAYELFGAVAFAIAGHECEAGAYHGATEALFRERGTANLEEDVNVICGGAAVYFYELNCLHGVGHGLMAWTSYEIYDALGLCDRLTGDRNQRACYSGIFMENVTGGLSGNMGHFTDYLSDDDPHYPCNDVDFQHVEPCCLYHSTRMLMLFDNDFEKTGAACAEAPHTAVDDCFDSFGRDVAAVTLGEPARAIEMCHDFSPGAEHKINCLKGTAQARFWEIEKADEAITTCTLLIDTEEKNWCYWTITVRALELFRTDEAYQGFCVRVEANFRDWCSQKVGFRRS